MELIRVNDWQAAKLFFEEYDIPYEEITEGEDKGKLLVRPVRDCDREQEYEAIKRLERSRLNAVTDHPNVFRDRNDNAIITFSPYNVDELPKNRPWFLFRNRRYCVRSFPATDDSLAVHPHYTD